MIINLEQKTHTLWHSDCEVKYAPSMKKLCTRSTTSHPNIVETLVECTACGKQGLYPRGRVGPIDVKEHLGETNKMEVTAAEEASQLKSEISEMEITAAEEASQLKLKISEMKLQFNQSTARHDNDLKAAMEQVDNGIAEYNLMAKRANNSLQAAEQAIAMLNLYAPKWLKIELRTMDEKVI